MDLKDKKVLVVTTTDNMIWQFLLPHIKSMQETGCVVDCACARTSFFMDELKDKFKLNVYELGFTRFPFTLKNIKYYGQLKKIVKDNKYDLIYCHQPVGGVFGRKVAKACGIPVIYIAHGFHFYKGCSIVNKLLYKNIERHYSKNIDALVTMNEEDYQAALKFKAKKVYKINGIGYDKKKYSVETKTKEEARKDLNLNKNNFVILTVAEFIKRKNYDTMLKTIAEMKDSNVKFLICGRGKLENEIRQQIKDLNIQDNVEILGYRKDINNIMTASDVFFLPSHHEGLTLSIIEALNFGLPIITSNVRGNRDLVENEINGFVCEQNSYQDFSEKLNLLKSNSELCKSMGTKSKKIAGTYNINTVKQQLNEIYKNIN